MTVTRKGQPSEDLRGLTGSLFCGTAGYLENLGLLKQVESSLSLSLDLDPSLDSGVSAAAQPAPE